ncbi:Spermatogenesis-associated serine-rich protein 1 [Vulpes lagopus]
MVMCFQVLNTVIFWNLRDALPIQHPLAESLAADLDLKSSSHSVHSSETSLPEDPKDKYPEEFSLLKLQTNIDPRNGIPKLTPGDNPYMYPEQSKDFHKAGSTLPPVNFSIVPYEKKYDTFIPLEPLPQIPT